MDEPPPLDFWSFVDVASRRIGSAYGPQDELATRVLLTLNRASDLVTYDLETSAHRTRGHGWATFRLLFAIWLVGPLEPSAAALLTGTTRAAVSGLTRSLVVKGLLERRPAERDGRSVQLALTDEGRDEITAVFGLHHERELAWVGALTIEEQRTLVALLTKLISRRDGFDVRLRH